MASRDWINLWRVSLLSILGGFCSSAIYLFAHRADEYFETLRHQEELAREAFNPSGVIACYFESIHPLWWVNASVWNIILFLLFGLLGHRLLGRRVRSVFLLWQIIGATVIVAGGLTVLVGVVEDGYLNQGALPWEKILEGFIYTRHQIEGFKFVAVMVASNVIYGTILHVASRQYESHE